MDDFSSNNEIVDVLVLLAIEYACCVYLWTASEKRQISLLKYF